MSRSKRIPMIVCSHQIDKDKAHRRVRRRVNVALQSQDFEAIDLLADTRDVGAEEWGTKYGCLTSDILGSDDDWDIEIKTKASRK